MKLYSEGKKYKLYSGDMLDLNGVVAPNSIESIVTDPPYELNFMDKGWDNSGIAFKKETWERCFNVLKPGGYLLVFGGSRTSHRIACAIEDAGFEIRDTIMWLYGSGFPKSMNLGKAIESKLVMGSANTQEWKNLDGEKVVAGNLGFSKMQFDQGARPNNYMLDGHLRTTTVTYTSDEGRTWDGWGTALKPAYEPIIIARKPCEGTCVDNVLKYGVGGINIDGCRIGSEERTYKGMSVNKPENAGCFRDDDWQPKDIEVTVNGRFPANVILTYDDTDYEEVCGGMPDTKPAGNKIGKEINKNLDYNASSYKLSNNKCPKIAGDNGGSAARYFYCAKASKEDRDEGLDINPDQIKNTHPTVKPCDLMRYLVRLVTPPGGTVLDPFNGSGSTGKAVILESLYNQSDYKYIGIELTEEYLPISDARLKFAENRNVTPTLF